MRSAASCGQPRHESAEPRGARTGDGDVGMATDYAVGVARRTGTTSAFGARFDMETDALLILVLSVHVARVFDAWWVVIIGLLRYALWGAEQLLPWLRAPVPPRFWRKVVASATGQTLTYVSTGWFPRWFVLAALAVVLTLLLESFGRDIAYLRTHARADR